MRTLLSLGLLVAACGTEEPTGPEVPQPVDRIWTATIHAGDLIVLVPGTASYDYLGATIDSLGANPVVDVRAIKAISDDAIVMEQAIAAAHRAGIADDEIESGALTFGLWGAGFETTTAFTYLSWEGLHVPITNLGGANSCAHGRVIDNLFNYTPENAAKDANDLYAKIRAWVAAHPAPAGRDVIVASHSWGGAVAEYLAFERATIVAAQGELADAAMPFTIAAGVPAYVPNYVFAGPTFRDLPATALYEIDRPDDPVHAMNPSGNPDGHQYDITFGDDFRGSYGVTTMELSCAGVAGICH